MQKVFELEAINRDSFGTSASRRIRRKENYMPAIIYGGTDKPVSISINHNNILKVTKEESFYSQIINLKLEGKIIKAVLKHVQRHVFKNQYLHMDFLRVTPKTVLKQKLPVHFINDDKTEGVKLGGNIHHLANEIDIVCCAKDLPEFVTVDLEGLDLDSTINAQDIKLPAGVSLANPDKIQPVVNITKGE
jgi:large subunit ribosomal protein L25